MNAVIPGTSLAIHPDRFPDPVEAVPTDQDAGRAVLAGGCFWCMEPPYNKQVGVSATISGYMGGELENPTYEQISRGGTGHIEVVQIEYDDSRIIADGSDFFRVSVVIRSPLD